LLDKQFFQDEQFHPYLTQNFLLFRAHRGTPEGDEIYKRFSVRATPTVMIVMADGREIDRVLGYDPPPEKFKDQIEEAYQGEDTFLNLTQIFKKDPNDLAVLAKLAEKYRSNYIFDKMSEYSSMILKQSEKARQIMLPFGKDKAEVSAYEFAMFASTYSSPEAVLEFAIEFPKSNYLDDVFGDFWRTLLNKDQQEKALEVFDKLIIKFPENSALIGSYLTYCSRSKTNYDRGIELADRIYKAKAGKIDLDFASAYAGLLIEKGDIKKVQSITKEIIKNNPDREKDIRMQLGYLYQEKKNYGMAFETFEKLIKDYPDYYPAFYQIGRTAVYSGENLDQGIACLKKYLQHEPDEGQPTLSNAHWRLGSIYEHKGDKESAKKEYEAALKLDPNYKAAKDALEKLNESK
jgi:tetratricopeptide (TPR) repeat protein